MKIIITEEQDEKLNQRVKMMVEKLGLKDAIKMFGGNTNIIRHVYNNKFDTIVRKIINNEFPGFSELYYSWANFNCGMGECCDMYAVGFVLPDAHYDDYLFKLVDSDNYEEYGDYVDYPEDLPEPCYEQPNINDTRFDTIILGEEMGEIFSDEFGDIGLWKKELLNIINEKFKINVTNIETY